MTVYLSQNNSMKELLPEEAYAMLSDKNFYKVIESNGCRFELSGNKIKNQMGRLLKAVSEVVIVPTEN